MRRTGKWIAAVAAMAIATAVSATPSLASDKRHYGGHGHTTYTKVVKHKYVYVSPAPVYDWGGQWFGVQDWRYPAPVVRHDWTPPGHHHGHHHGGHHRSWR